jgi:hypothetical protein
MRKFIIFLTIVVFFGCLAMGLYTSNLLPLNGQANAEAVTKPPGGLYQRNIAIIHVDDLKAENPNLISIWGLIFYYPEPQIIFQPLYPIHVDGNQNISSRFAITKNGDPNPVFMQFLSEDNKITWDNYILVDSDGISLFTSAIAGAALPEGSDSPDIVLTVESALYGQFCNTVMTNPQLQFNSVTWTDLIPDHFHSNIILDDILSGWARLTRVEQPLDCQVFGQ